MHRPPAFHSRHHKVLQTDVRKRSAHHHLMVPAARAVGVEIRRLYPQRNQIFSRGRIHRDAARRRNMVRRDAVAQHGQHARAVNVFNRSRLPRHAFEIRRILDVGGRGIPRVQLAFRHRHLAPFLGPGEHVAVLFAEHSRSHRRAHGLLDFRGRRPDFAQIDRLALRVAPQRFAGHVEVHASGQRVRHHQRRRGKIIRAHERIDSPFEIPVPAEHRDGHERIVFDGRGHRFR